MAAKTNPEPTTRTPESDYNMAVTFGDALHSVGMALERMAAAAGELRRLASEAGCTSGPAVTTRLSVRLLPPGEAVTQPHHEPRGRRSGR